MIPHKKHCKRHAVNNKAKRNGELNRRKVLKKKGFAIKQLALAHLGLDQFRREFVDAIFTPPLERTLQPLDGHFCRSPFRSTQIPCFFKSNYQKKALAN